VRIRTGELEDHIVADVAWAACRYTDWTGSSAWLAGPGRALVLDTARYWASRVRWDPAGRAHIDGVIGPDEYHVEVNDNAFTNVMARWNLRRAASLAEWAGGATPDEIQARRRLADALVDGYDPASGRYRQFAGFDDLEPLLIGELARPPVAADLVLGRARVRGGPGGQAGRCAHAAPAGARGDRGRLPRSLLKLADPDRLAVHVAVR
jgi:trehalose/maltose hydrolase-like predicted phosphorylase